MWSQGNAQPEARDRCKEAATAGKARQHITRLRKTLGSFYASTGTQGGGSRGCKKGEEGARYNGKPLLPREACEGVADGGDNAGDEEWGGPGQDRGCAGPEDGVWRLIADDCDSTTRVATTNVAYSPEGFGHCDGTDSHTPLGRYLRQLRRRPVHVDAIQEHRMGPFDYHDIPGLGDVTQEYAWVGWPGRQDDDNGARSRGLGFMLHVSMSVIDSEYSQSDLCEVASITTKRAESAMRQTFINAYLVTGGGIDAVNEFEAMVNMHMAKAHRLAPIAFWVLGDLNVNACMGRWSSGKKGERYVPVVAGDSV